MRAGARRATAALRSVATAVLLLPVHLWRATSVMRQPRCRFYPSCSTYAVGALRVHGPVRGSALAAGRLLRCHPWSPGGVDYVPLRQGRMVVSDGAGSGAGGASPVHSSRRPVVTRSAVESSGVRDA